MNFSDLTVALNLNIAQFTNALNTARRQWQRFSTSMASGSATGTAEALVNSYTTLNDRLHRVGLGLRDIARISSGIVVSQTFYGITRSINEATDALWQFNESLDYAKVSYSALFEDSALANDFLATLQQFSVDTIFEFSDLEKMSRKLLAYGMEYENLMYIIEGLTNIGTMSGDPAALERLAVAIGQINAKGYLQAEEVRQLVNAYAPMQDILRERFGLSDEDFGRLSDLKLPADDVINAIVEYANDRFGDVSEAAMLTLTGLKNRIVDTLKVMGVDIMAPLTVFYKSLLRFIADQLNAIHDAYEQNGLGGIFEYLVPSAEWQTRLRQLFANLQNFVYTTIALFHTLAPVFGQVFGGLIDGFNILLAVVNAAASGVTAAIQSLAGNTPVLTVLSRALVIAAAAWALFRIQALGAAVLTGLRIIIVKVAEAVLLLSRALMSNPILTMLVLFGAALIGLSANANNANSAISKLLNTLNSYSAGGKTADDILQTNNAMEEGATNADQFWNAMGEGAEETGDAVEDAGNKAKKASKSLLSFDEVFRLNDSSDSGAGAGLGDLSGIGDLAEMLGGLGSALIPEIPDLSSYASDFVNTLYHELWDSMKTIASGAATGAVIGGLVGFTIGGLVTRTMAGALGGAKLGAKIGAALGAGFAAFWTDAYKEMESSLAKIAIGSALGVLIGGLVGMVLGAFATRTIDGALLGARYGATIGGLIGAGVGGFWAIVTEEMSNAIEAIAAGGAAGALIGGLVGLVLGAFSTRTLQGALTGALYGSAIGAAIGGALATMFVDFESTLGRIIQGIAVGGAAGVLVGGLVGLVLGAFATKTLQGALAGAQLGAAIGGIIGAGIGTFWAVASDETDGAIKKIAAGGATGALIGGLVGLVLGAFATKSIKGAITGAGVGAAIGTIIGGALGSAFADFESDLAKTIQAIAVGSATGALIGGLVGLVLGAFSTKTLQGALTGAGVGAGIGTILGGALGTAFGDFESDLGKTIQRLAVGTATGVLIGALAGLFIGAFSTRTLQGALTGAKYGATIGGILGGTLPGIFNAFEGTLKAQIAKIAIGSAEGALIGALTGMFLGAFATRNFNGALTGAKYGALVGGMLGGAVNGVFNDAETTVKDRMENMFSGISAASTGALIGGLVGMLIGGIVGVFAGGVGAIPGAKIGATLGAAAGGLIGYFVDALVKQDFGSAVKKWWEGLFDPDTWRAGWTSVKSWFSNLWDDISNWFSSLSRSVKRWWDGLWSDKTSAPRGVVLPSSGSGRSGTWSLRDSSIDVGHARGGIFNREHIARFAEGNKAEAIIPLENNTAMRPFVDAISDGILQGLLPAVATNNGSSSALPPMYVGALIADDRGLRELYKKFEVIEAKELARKGLSTDGVHS